MDDQLPDFGVLTSAGDISNDGTLGIPDTSNVQVTEGNPDYSGLSLGDYTVGNNGVGVLDNINGTSNTDGNASPALLSMFQTSTPVGGILDYLTAGALGLADQLAGDILPTPANQPAATDYTPYILAGVGVLILVLVIK